jgi:L-alanine-DL-glutamate epimerase-like enolase superfamily enzyme
MLAEPVAVAPDGMLRVPAAPGLGVRLDEEAVGFYAAGHESVTVR